MLRPRLIGLAMLVATLAAGPLPYTGVNLAGGEFYKPEPGVRPVYGKNFIFPTDAEVGHFTAKGMNVIRLGFRWETLQPHLRQPLDRPELDRLAAVVHSITRRGCVAILNPHNFARHYGHLIGGPGVTPADFADLWRQLADRFKADDHVWFGLVNEPHGTPAEQWVTAANAALAAIRHAGAKNMVLVPGTSWTGAHSWVSSGNAAAMAKLVDPADHYLFEVHQYLDPDSSGGTDAVVDPFIGVKRLAVVTDWARQTHHRLFLGEFAAADTPAGKEAIERMLNYVEANPDVWAGWCWWAAGPWWHEYMFTLEPRPDGTDRPQMAWLTPHLHGAATTRPGR